MGNQASTCSIVHRLPQIEEHKNAYILLGANCKGRKGSAASVLVATVSVCDTQIGINKGKEIHTGWGHQDQSCSK